MFYISSCWLRIPDIFVGEWTNLCFCIRMSIVSSRLNVLTSSFLYISEYHNVSNTLEGGLLDNPVSRMGVYSRGVLIRGGA